MMFLIDYQLKGSSMAKFDRLDENILCADIDQQLSSNGGGFNHLLKVELKAHLKTTWTVEALEFFSHYLCFGSLEAHDSKGARLWGRNLSGRICRSWKEYAALREVFGSLLKESFMLIGALRLLKVAGTTISPSTYVFGKEDDLLKQTASELYEQVLVEYEKRIRTRQSRLNEQISLFLKAFDEAGIKPPKLSAPKKHKK